MKCYFKIFLLISTFCSVANSQNSFDDPFIQTITSEQINSAGLVRLSDIFTLIKNWDSYTIDGYRWNIAANGLESFKRQRWQVMIDGQVMNINFLDMQNINTLPVTLQQIDSVLIYNSPTIENGRFSGSGLIHLISKKTSDGISLGGSYNSGNPSGDPGPFIYIGEDASENVEEIGPDISAYLSAKKDATDGYLYFLTQSHPSTNINIRLRNQDLDWQTLKSRRFSSAVSLNTEVLNSTHSLFAGYSTSEQQSFQPEETGTDLFFFYPSGKELPVQTIYKHFGINGAFPLNAERLIYNAQVTNQKLLTAAGYDYADFDWNLTSYFLNAKYDFNAGKVNSEIGSNFDYSELNTHYPVVDKSIINFNLYTKLKFQEDKFKNELGVYLALVNNIFSPKLFMSSSLLLSNNNQLSLKLSYIKNNLAEDNNLWYWQSKGYSFLDSLGTEYSISDRINNKYKFTADVFWDYFPAKKIMIRTGVIYRYFGENYIETQNYNFDPATFLFISPTNVFADQNGQVAGLSLLIKQQVFDVLNHSLYYRFQKTISGDQAFINEWSSVPRHKIKYEIIFIPAEDFSLRAALTYTSETLWPAYDNVEIQSEGFYSSKIPEQAVIDLSAQKWFWGKRFRFSILLQNLFNSEVMYHPLGANFTLSMFLKFELMLNSIIKL